MLQMSVKIFQSGETWMIQVSTNPPGTAKAYFFQKGGFASQTDAKNFFITNTRMFALQMGEL